MKTIVTFFDGKKSNKTELEQEAERKTYASTFWMLNALKEQIQQDIKPPQVLQTGNTPCL